jgi:hypothetical protein
MSVTHAEGVFSHADLRGSERGMLDASKVNGILRNGQVGAEKHRFYTLVDPEQREAHDAFALLMGLSLPDIDKIGDNAEIQEDFRLVDHRPEAVLTRQIIASKTGATIIYWAHVEQPTLIATT